MGSPVTIRTMTAADAAAAAELHVASLPGLFTRLGPGVVQAFYHAAVRLPDTVALAIELPGGRHGGQALGTVESSRYYWRALMAMPRELGGRIGAEIIRRPGMLAEIRRGRQTSGAELLFLAVQADLRGTGQGAKLLRAFDAAMIARGLSYYELTVNADNERAVAFYDAFGLHPVATFEEFGFRRLRYRRVLEP